ncbi:serine/threonine protein kinase [Mesorhizobium sp. M0320]|uniref:serine/threonine-protein kinase n=1 Tax=Mesorhizobium TaxID=68287 RepID=UPI00333C6B11
MARIYGNRWEGIEGNLGEGGQGHVIKVIDRQNPGDGPFALKRILNPKRADRFRNEVDAIKRLKHPNVIELLDHSALDAQPQDGTKQYIVMPVAEGGDLGKSAAQFVGDLGRTLGVAKQVAAGLKAAHDASIIHRDIKPANILLTGNGDEVWISDFGICLIEDGRQRNTPSGEVVGPALFMAPELEHGGQLDVTAAADVYSLGKVILFLFTGVRLPRESLSDPKYAPMLAAPGLEGLRLLLTQMICPLPRISTMDTMIMRLDQLQSIRNGGGSGLSKRGLTALEDFKQTAATEAQRKLEESAERTRSEDLINAVAAAILAALTRQFQAGAAAIHTDGAINSIVQEVRIGSQIKIGRYLFMPISGIEITFQNAVGKYARIWALQMFVCRKIGFHGGGLFVLPYLELRESDGRPVKGCSAFLRKTGSKSDPSFEVTDSPTVLEIDPKGWDGDDQVIRDFAEEATSALPHLVKGDWNQFHQMPKPDGPRGRR